MTSSKDFPIPPSAPRPPSARFVPPAWAAPPANEPPVAVHLGKFLHRSPHMVVAVRSAEVYSTGCSFSLSWMGPPTIAFTSSGGSGAGDELAGTGSAWIWPLTPAGHLRLLAQWMDFGLAESSVVLDGGTLRDAAAGVQQFWAEGGQP